MARNYKVPDCRKPYFDEALNCYRVPLAHGKTALIDAADAGWVGQYIWTWHSSYLTSNGCATTRRGRENRIVLARAIAGAADGEMVNHKNDDTLDCRRDNLRRCRPSNVAMRSRKQRNRTSQYKGVSRHRGGKWTSTITVCGVYHYLGLFADERRAAEKYDDAAREHFGEFARLNFPDPAEDHTGGPTR